MSICEDSLCKIRGNILSSNFFNILVRFKDLFRGKNTAIFFIFGIFIVTYLLFIFIY